MRFRNKNRFLGGFCLTTGVCRVRFEGMEFFKITFANGNSIKTFFNGALDDAKNYYLGHYFELDENKPSVIVISVEEIL